MQSSDAQVAAPDSPAGQRLTARSRFRFSLRALLECMLAYGAAFTAAVCRPNWILAASVCALTLIAFVAFSVWQKQQRTVLHYFVLALFVAGGVFGGPRVLREVRRHSVAALIALDQQTLERVARELMTPEEGEEPDHCKHLARTRDLILTRDAQLNAIVENADIPIPKTPEEWSPLAVPVDQRLDLPVTCELSGASMDEFMDFFQPRRGQKLRSLRD